MGEVRPFGPPWTVRLRWLAGAVGTGLRLKQKEGFASDGGAMLFCLVRVKELERSLSGMSDARVALASSGRSGSKFWLRKLANH